MRWQPLTGARTDRLDGEPHGARPHEGAAGVPLDAVACFEQAWHARAQGAVGEVHAFEPYYEGSPVVLGAGFTLLTSDADAVQTFHDAAAALQIPLKIVPDRGCGVAVRYQAQLVLIRPDQFAACSTGQTTLVAEDASKVLKSVSGA